MHQRRHTGHWALSMFIAGLMQMGCVGPATTLTSQTVATSNASPAWKGDELPAAKKLEACLAVAQNLDKSGNDTAAKQQYETVLQLDPNNPIAIRRLAVIYSRQCDFSRAEAQFAKAVKNQPHDANLLNDWGYCCFLQNKWSDAEKKFREAIEADPEHARARCNLGMALGQKGRYEEALHAFQDAHLRESDARCNLAFIYWTQGKLDDARQQCRSAQQLDSTNMSAQAILSGMDHPVAKRSKAEPIQQVAATPQTVVPKAKPPEPLADIPIPPAVPIEEFRKAPTAAESPSPIIYRSPNGIGWIPVKRQPVTPTTPPDADKSATVTPAP